MVSPRLVPQPPATHGGAGRGIDLSASLNPLGPSRLALEAARTTPLDRYPELDAGPLRRAAAGRHSVAEEAVVPMPGAGFGLWLVMAAFLQPGDACLALAPCFGEYRRCAAMASADYREMVAAEPSLDWDVDQLDDQLDRGVTMCVVANPANPSGRGLPAERLSRLCRDHPETVLVLDEAFAAFGPPGLSLLEDPSLPGNAIVVRSLTKELGLPGLRMGYLVAHPEVAAQIAGIMPPWPLSSPSLAAAVAGMEDRGHVAEGARVARTHVGQLADALGDAGASPLPSDANYLLVRAPGAVAALAGHGITVRDCGSFGLPDHVRIAAPSPADLSTVLEAIRALDVRSIREHQR